MSFLAGRRSPAYDKGTYESGGYRGSMVVVVALTLILVCGWAGPHRSHGVDASQSKRDQSTVEQTQTVEQTRCKKAGTQIEQVDGTGSKLDRYATVARPAWAREHRGREWPDTVDELNKYIGACDSLDSWGHPIKLLCGPKVPGGGCTLVSAGADGKFDTDDDQAPW